MVLLGFCLMYLMLFFDLHLGVLVGGGGLAFIFTFFLNKKYMKAAGG